MACASNGSSFAVYSTDKQIRVFHFATGKLKRKYDESSAFYQQLANSGTAVSLNLSGADLGRKIAMERELEGTPESLRLCTLAFDETGNFLIYGSVVGIKIVNIVTNRVARILGGVESGERFLSVSLYQGTPVVDTQFLLSQKGSAAATKTVDETQSANVPDPTVYCSSLKRRRFYTFSQREPDESEQPRDVLNERPTEEERVSAADVTTRGLAREAVIRTSRGDIHLKLFAAECPKTVENFVTHARNGYYNNLVFHRVIKGFMIQVRTSRRYFYSLIQQ